MRGAHVACPRCSNVKKGTKIYSCKKCAMIFCHACCKKNAFLDDECPRCGASTGVFIDNWEVIGEVGGL